MGLSWKYPGTGVISLDMFMTSGVAVDVNGLVQDTKRAPQISIVTVAFNSAATIEQTIRSVSEQVGVDLEYIVIDGASTDGTLEIIRRHSAAITIWVSEPDGGIYDAMNKGLRLASGEWVLFLNSDDYMASPQALALLVRAARTDVAIVAGGTTMRSGDVVSPFRASRYLGLPLQLPFMHPSTMVRRSAFVKWGVFDTQYRLAADCDLLLRLITRGERYHLIDEQITIMRDGGASSQGYSRGRREYRKAYGRNTGNVTRAWIGYIVSMLLHLKSKWR